MADNSKKVSELPVTTNVASTDRVLVLRDPAGSPSVRTITVNNFISNVASAVVANAAAQINSTATTAYTNAVAYANSILVNNLVNYPTKTEFQANLTSTSLNRSILYVIQDTFTPNTSHEVLLADPNIVTGNVTINLPYTNIANGKVYTVKCMSNGGNTSHQVIVTSPNMNCIENDSGVYVNEFYLTSNGMHRTWIQYNGAYRQI